MSRTWSVKTRLMASALVATLGVAALAGFNVYSGRVNSQALEQVHASSVRSLVQLQKLDGLVREARFRAAGVALDIVSVQGSHNHVREMRKELQDIWLSLDRSSAALDPEQRDLLEDMERGWNNVTAVLDKIERAYEAKSKDQLLGVLEADWAELHKNFAKPLDKLMPLKETEARRIYEEATAANTRLNRSSFLLAAVVAALTGCLLLFMSRSLSRQLGGEPADAAHIVRTIADGDLTTEITIAPRDGSSLLHAMKRMQEQLRGTASVIQTAAGFVAGASTQISSGNAELSRRAEEQASSLEETASSMEELTRIVQLNAGNATQASELAAGAT